MSYQEYYRKQGQALMPVRWMDPIALQQGESCAQRTLRILHIRGAESHLPLSLPPPPLTPPTPGVFTVSTDVFSYGVTLWEIVTYANLPWPGHNNQQVFEKVIAGERMKQPAGCPDAVYYVMQRCWANKNERADFEEVKARIDNIHDRLEQGSQDVDLMCSVGRPSTSGIDFTEGGDVGFLDGRGSFESGCIMSDQSLSPEMRRAAQEAKARGQEMVGGNNYDLVTEITPAGPSSTLNGRSPLRNGGYNPSTASDMASPVYDNSTTASASQGAGPLQEQLQKERMRRDRQKKQFVVGSNGSRYDLGGYLMAEYPQKKDGALDEGDDQQDDEDDDEEPLPAAPNAPAALRNATGLRKSIVVNGFDTSDLPEGRKEFEEQRMLEAAASGTAEDDDGRGVSFSAAVDGGDGGEGDDGDERVDDFTEEMVRERQSRTFNRRFTVGVPVYVKDPISGKVGFAIPENATPSALPLPPSPHPPLPPVFHSRADGGNENEPHAAILPSVHQDG